MGSKIINISLPEPLLTVIDEVATEENRTRSEFFREAARRYIEDLKGKFHASPRWRRFQDYEKEILHWFEEYRRSRRVRARARRILKRRGREKARR